MNLRAHLTYFLPDVAIMGDMVMVSSRMVCRGDWNRLIPVLLRVYADVDSVANHRELC